MKQMALPLAAALLAGGAVYGLLAAVRPAPAAAEDPWIEAWTRAGLQAQLRATSTEPGRHLQLRLERERFKGPGFAGTRLRSYAVHGVRAQVVELPSAGMNVFDHPEGDEEQGTVHYGTGDMDHYLRRGRYMLVLADRQRVAFWTIQLPKEIREKAFTAFRETAGRLSP